MGGFTVFDIDYSKQRVGINTQLRLIEQHKCYFKQKKQWENTFEIQKTTTLQIINANFFYQGGSIP